MNESIDWDELIQKHIDGLTSEAEAESLSDEIVGNPEVRARYLKATQIHGALTEEASLMELEGEVDEPTESSVRTGAIHRMGWPQQLAAALVGGAFFGIIGVGVAWAVGSPKSEARALPVANGNFESFVGKTKIGFPKIFGEWSGDPAEVIKRPDGTQLLRFLETANVTGKPNGGAAACNLFQLVDLSSLQQEWATDDIDTRVTLELSATFLREAAPTDKKTARSKATCTIQLYQAPPESIGQKWPNVIADALAVGNRRLLLKPNGESETISASCILDPDANLALISVNVNAMTASTTPTRLGGWYADDVKLTLIKQPTLPVRFVK